MTNKKLIFGVLAAFLFASIILTGCSGEAKNNDNEKVMANEEMEHDHEMHNHNEGGEHMKHMNEVREKLKGELGDKYNAVVPPATKEQLVLGEKIYTQNCLSCHGEQGKGDGPASVGLPTPPANFTDVAHATFYSEEGRRQIIRKGIAGSVMIPWETVLKENEIDAVYGYIKSLANTENVSHE